jgi:hypothetical protein
LEDLSQKMISSDDAKLRVTSIVESKGRRRGEWKYSSTMFRGDTAAAADMAPASATGPFGARMSETSSTLQRTERI